MMIIWCMLLSPIFCYVILKAGSVIALVIIHKSLNGTFGRSIMLLKSGSDLTTGVTGLPGFLVLFLINVTIWFHMKWKERNF